MKILQIINVRWYNATAYYALLLARTLAENGHRVILAGNKHTPVVAKAREAGLTVFDQLNLNTDNPLVFFRNVFVLKKMFEQEKIEIVNAHRGEMYLAIALAARLAKNKPVLIRTRGDQRAPKNNIINRLVHRYLVDRVIVTTNKLKEKYQQLAFPQENISVIFGGVNNKFLDTPLPAGRSVNEKFVFGILGRLSPVKGHFNLIKALAGLSREYPGCELQIAGGSCEISEEQLIAYAAELKVSNQVHILGFVEDEMAFIDGLDCGIVASEGSEMISRVLFEYGARKKLCLVTPVNSLKEIIHSSRNGIVAAGSSSEDLQDSMREILEMVPEKRSVLAENFWQEVKSVYQPDSFLKATLNAYIPALTGLTDPQTKPGNSK